MANEKSTPEQAQANEQGAKDFNALIRGAVAATPLEGVATPAGETQQGAASMNTLMRARIGKTD